MAPVLCGMWRAWRPPPSGRHAAKNEPTQQFGASFVPPAGLELRNAFAVIPALTCVFLRLRPTAVVRLAFGTLVHSLGIQKRRFQSLATPSEIPVHI